MKTETITCDRCKQSATTKEEKDKQNIQRVAIGVFSYSYSNEYNFRAKDSTHIADWCRACCIELGIVHSQQEELTPTSPLSLEDLIREIAYEAATEALVNNR